MLMISHVEQLGVTVMKRRRICFLDLTIIVKFGPMFGTS